MNGDDKQQELEELRKRMQLEEQKKALLRRILTPDAYERMINVKTANQDMYNMALSIITNAVQTGRMRTPINDNQLKQILMKLAQRTHRESKINILRK